MYTVGLTGNIASGKSTVCNLLADKGVYIIDTDTVAHTLLADQSQQAIVCSSFGEAVMTEGALDRGKLRRHVFSHLSYLRTLEALLHQPIRTQVCALLASGQAQAAVYAVVAVPLLFETGWNHLCDTHVLVLCDAHKRRARLVQRQLEKATIETLLLWQIEERMTAPYCDHLLDNNQSLDAFTAQVTQLHHTLTEAAIHKTT